MNQKGIVAEEAVHHMASKTYLKYWCFPNPLDELGNKKEFCDLLILFDNKAFLIEVKNYEFKGNYDRYFRNTLEKAIKQLQGAERKLFHSNRKISFEHPLKGVFDFNPKNYSSVHRIIINLSNIPLFYPAGTLNKNNSFIHILNWNAFLNLIGELDTIPDLDLYLKEREVTFSKKQLVFLRGEESDWTPETTKEFHKYSSTIDPTSLPFIMASGNESDLIADYFFNAKKFNEHFYSTEYNGMDIELDGEWNRYLNTKQVQDKKKDDKDSYFIDEFIEREVLHFDDDKRIEMATDILKLNRLQRRIAGNNFKEFVKKHKGMGDYHMARRFGRFDDFGLSYFMHGNGIDLDGAMKMMSIAVEGFSYYDNYKCKKLLMIGIDESLTQTKFVYLNKAEPIKGKRLEDLLFNLKTLSWFTNMKETQKQWKEFPE